MRSKANREISGRIISKGVARIDVIERAVYGNALPELNKTPRETASEFILRTYGVNLSSQQARAYMKMISRQQSEESTDES